MSKIDQSWAQSIRENVNALVLEIERLEAIQERVGKILDPYYSGGDLEYLAKNVINNFKANLKSQAKP